MLLYSVVVAFLAGCGTYSPKPAKPGNTGKPSSRYQQQQDSAPLSHQDLEKIPDALPVVEAVSKRGNQSPYEVGGVNYWLLPSSKGYRGTGRASWYGAKFHGHETSNGEIYNMFGMSAAHRGLPLPTYLQVTNLDNGRKVIVRVNDRGPFHSERIIDLSYAAAVKLGFAAKGTANVQLEAIDPVAWQLARERERIGAELVYLQVGAFSQFESAAQLQRRVQAVTTEPVSIHPDTDRSPVLHKVQIGPIKDMLLVRQIKEKLSALGLGTPLIIPLIKS